MRKFIIRFTIVVSAFFGIISLVQPASAQRGPCGPAGPWNSRPTGCPGQPVASPAPHFGHQVINGPRSNIRYALRYNCGNGPCLYGRVAYNPPVRSPYFVGNVRPPVRTGMPAWVGNMSRAQTGGQMRVQQVRTAQVEHTENHTSATCTWHRENGGPKIYDNPSCPPPGAR